MDWHRPGDKPLSESMMHGWFTDVYICVTRPQWFNLSTVPLEASDAHASVSWVSIFSGNSLSPVGTRPLPQSLPIYCQKDHHYLKQNTILLMMHAKRFNWKCWLHTGGHFVSITSLPWRYNGRGSVSNHQPRDCLLNRLFRRRSKKTSKLHVTGLCAGNSPVPGEFPAQMASNAENVSIW